MAGLGLSQIRCFWSVADQKHEFEIVPMANAWGGSAPPLCFGCGQEFRPGSGGRGSGTSPQAYSERRGYTWGQ